MPAMLPLAAFSDFRSILQSLHVEYSPQPGTRQRGLIGTGKPVYLIDPFYFLDIRL
jgi:hypothetical protein